mgnify:FL=1
MDDLKKFLTDKVLLFESDTLLPETEKVLENIRREKTDKPVVYLSSGTSSIIAGSEKTWSSVKTYLEENSKDTELVRVGCNAPLSYEPFMCVQLPEIGRAHV